MKNIKQLHREAMALIKEASSALVDGDTLKYVSLANRAFEKEREAAMELLGDFDSEPTRSVLFRSAGNIAFNLGNFAEAQKLAHLALAGNPFEELKEELNYLLEKAQKALESNASDVIGYENAYIDSLRERAVNLKLEATELRYSRAIIIEHISDFLKNIQNSFSNFSEVNFKKLFGENDFKGQYDKILNLFKKDTKALCVGLRFKSFGVSIAVDTSIQNYQDINSPKFKEFKNVLFEKFKEEILFADFNTAEYQERIEKQYTVEERIQIFSPIIDSFKENSKYRISVVDKEFKNIIKECPVINKKTISVLKPSVKKETLFDDSEVLIKRTLELTNTAGQKGEKILSENLEYAEFRVSLKNLNYDGKDAFFVNPYDQKVIFNHGTFLIDDDYYKIYVEGESFKQIESVFAKELITKFDLLLIREAEAKEDNEELSIDDKTILDIFKTTLIKGW